MMSQDDLDRLDAVRAGAFEQMWLQMMVEHHEGAIEMSRTEVQEGQSADAVALAEDIIESQTAEIDLMQDLLRADWSCCTRFGRFVPVGPSRCHRGRG